MNAAQSDQLTIKQLYSIHSKMKYLTSIAVLLFIFGDAIAYHLLTKKEVQKLKAWTDDSPENLWELSGQIEGDMVFRKGQRNGLIDEKTRWPNNEIPYTLSSSFSQEQQDWIHNSLKEFEEKTCVKVRPKTDDDDNWVSVYATDTGCWSFVGFHNGLNLLNLAPSSPGSGCLRSGTIVHEFLHQFGFYHQQSTYNRDDYVEIVWDNIEKGTENNFDKYSEDVVSNFGEPYDYGSVMHYGAYAFSNNGEKTIITKDPEVEIGQRIGLSAIDVSKLNQMYGCAK